MPVKEVGRCCEVVDENSLRAVAGMAAALMKQGIVMEFDMAEQRKVMRRISISAGR